jgi:hypothetical protein
MINHFFEISLLIFLDIWYIEYMCISVYMYNVYNMYIVIYSTLYTNNTHIMHISVISHILIYTFTFTHLRI